MNRFKKRIINPRRYLQTFPAGESLYIAATLCDEDIPKLRNYGLKSDAIARIPIPRGKSTQLNANGSWLTLRNLPKEPKVIEHPYHLTDWHGNDIYGVSSYVRMCYQKKLIPPTEVSFVVENGIIRSELLINSEESMDRIKAAMNILLEIVGHFNIWTVEGAEYAPPANIKEVPWEILRAGTRNQDEWVRYVSEIVEQRPKSHQAVIQKRHEYLWSKNPDFCILGKQNFFGYVVYGFSHSNLFVFESNQVNNASYIFKGNWEAASRLTKTEILAGHLHEARVFHTTNWYRNIQKAISGKNWEVA